jgi:hypothetical protein
VQQGSVAELTKFRKIIFDKLDFDVRI